VKKEGRGGKEGRGARLTCYTLSSQAEAVRANTGIGSKSAISLQRGPVDPKFQLDGVAPYNHSFSQKTSLNGFLYGVKTSDCFDTVHEYARLTYMHAVASVITIVIVFMIRHHKTILLKLSHATSRIHK